MHYHVTAKFKTATAPELAKKLQDGTIRNQSPDGEEIFDALHRAVITDQDEVEFSIVCHCSTPLFHERATVLDAHFDEIKTQTISGYEDHQGPSFIDHVTKLATKNEQRKPMSDTLAAYLVCSSFMPEGHGSIIPYGEKAHPILDKYEGELLVAGETEQFMEFFEGDWKENAKFTLFRFPSMEHLKGFWNSEEYQAIKHLRTDNTPPNFTFAVNAVDFSKWHPV